ncbi:HET-domain-containing protein [Xylaria venustula]|nr:HET-domain-containing protein [Xylaria venustula]
MWLINVKSKLLEEFIGLNVPKYAILSHTWEAGEEVTFQELAKEPRSGAKRGWWKIDQTCRQAEQDGLDYAWVDTCCIDKSSSAELSEAINSMFRWYQRAAVCYVYLADLLHPVEVTGTLNCRWFTRSWTLQELIAPKHVNFYSQDWEFCFTKAEAAVQLSHITGIELAVLHHETSLATICVAQKMSWARSRQATRTEDIAYSLLGIFDINMPLLYGEEEKAFMRLQSEIINSCTDPSIFAWFDDPIIGQSEGAADKFTGVLAASPSSFAGCQNFSMLPFRSIPNFSISNRGINIRANFGLDEFDTGSTLVLPVCQSPHFILGIKVRNLGGGLFIRQDPTAVVNIQPYDMLSRLMLNPILVTQLSPLLPANARWGLNVIQAPRQRGLQIVLGPHMEIYRRWPWTQWDEVDRIFFGPEDPDLGWAALKIVSSPPDEFLAAQNRRSFDFLLYIFGWQKSLSQTPRCTIRSISGALGDRALEDMNGIAVDENWNTYWVVNRLENSHVPEQSTVVVGSVGGRSLLVTCSLSIAEDRMVCASHFWRAHLNWEVVPSGQEPIMVDRRWQQMDWGHHWRVPWNDD